MNRRRFLLSTGAAVAAAALSAALAVDAPARSEAEPLTIKAASSQTDGELVARDLAISIGQYSDKGRKDTNQDFHGALIPQQRADFSRDPLPR